MRSYYYYYYQEGMKSMQIIFILVGVMNVMDLIAGEKILLVHPKCEIFFCALSYYSFFNIAIAKSFPMLFAIAPKSDKQRQIFREQFRKEAMTQCTNKKINKPITSDSFCYSKVGRDIPKCIAIGKMLKKTTILFEKIFRILGAPMILFVADSSRLILLDNKT